MSSPSANRQELDSPLRDDINAELALWKQLTFNMPSPTDNRHEDHPGQSHPSDGSTTLSSSQQSPPHFQLPLTGPPPLPPETYNYLIHALLSLQGSASHPYPQNYPPTYPHPIHSSLLPNYPSTWPPGTTPPIISVASIAGPSSFYPTNLPMPLPPHAVPQSAGSSQLSPASAGSPTTASTAPDPEGTEDAMSTTEDKRRRNTAASARFRLKRKIKTLNLERTVTDLAGRTEELEREAADLRRENAWLKEIVLLKGRDFTALNVGSQAPAPGNRHGGDERDDGTHTESEPESTVRRRGKGKERERREKI